MKLTKIVGTRVSKETFDRLDYIAKKQRRRRSDLIRIILEDFIEEYFAKIEAKERLKELEREELIEHEEVKRRLKNRPI